MLRIAPAALLIFALACGAAPTGVTEISPEALLAAPPEGALLLDVRSPGEFAGGHVPGAINVSHEALATRLDELGDDRERPVVVYCERGGRAAVAASLLLEAGFSDIRHLTGDMSAWRAAGRPTETP